MKAWRIVEMKYGNPYSLFHGLPPDRGSLSLRRSRCLGPVGCWFEAEEKLIVDGGGQKPYLSGFNVLLSREEAVKYLQRFRAPRKLRIAECEVEGLRQKPTNPSVWLAKKMKLVRIEV